MTSTTEEMVSKCAEIAEKWRTDRDDYIRIMRREGATLREIGAAAHLSHAAIAKIVARPQVYHPAAISDTR